jgi:hypothetical protein
MTTETTVRPTGRPLKLNPKVIRTLMTYVANGNYYQTAAYAAGVSVDSLDSWLKQGAEDYKTGRKGLFFGLFVAMKRAEAKSEAERVSRIRQAGIGGQVSRRVTRTKRDGTEETEETFQLPQWLADITFLERRHRERWGRPAPIQVNVDQSKTVQISHVEVMLSEAGHNPVIEGESRELLEGEDNV